MDAAAALLSTDLDPSGATSVGDGMFEANTMLTAASSAARHALVVLTDGKENRTQFIADVTLGAAVRAYAIGLGLPQEVDVAKLSAVTGNTGGYLLITGELDVANEFRLHKYYAQILAGIHGDSIVLDPRGTIDIGDIQRHPFYVTEADTRFDVVLLTHFKPLRFTLEAPDGTRIDPANADTVNSKFVEGRQCRYYRMKLPIFAGDLRRALGKWHIIIEYPGPRTYKGAFLRNNQRFVEAAALDNRNKLPAISRFSTKRDYNVIVSARSSIQMETQIEQKGFGPGADRSIVAFMRGFGAPLSADVRLFAQVTRPDGVSAILPLEHQGNGRFETALPDSKMFGLYNIVVHAAGQTPGGFPLRREQTLSGVVLDPAADKVVDSDTQEIKDLLKEHQDRLRELGVLFAEATAKLQPATPQPAGAGGDISKWLLWILIILILILILFGISLLRATAA